MKVAGNIISSAVEEAIKALGIKITNITVKVELTTAPAITLTDEYAEKFDIETGEDIMGFSSESSFTS